MQRAGFALFSLLVVCFLASIALAAPLPNSQTIVGSERSQLPESNPHFGAASARVTDGLQLGLQAVGCNTDGIKSSVVGHPDRIQQQVASDYQSPQVAPVRPRPGPTQRLPSSSRRHRPIRPAAPSPSRKALLDEADEVVVLHRRNIFKKIGAAFKKLGKKIKSGFQKAGKAIKKGFQKAGSTIKKGFQKAGSAMKKGFQKAGKAIKKGFQKVGHFIKTTGKKIAKGALKVIATVQAVASHVVKFIPVVGNAASTALKLSSKGLNAASDAIHANMGKKWDKASKVMDIVQDPIGSLAKAGAHKIVQHAATKYKPAPPSKGKAPSPPSAPARRGGKRK